MVSELFDAAAWQPVEGFDLHRHHLPPGGRRGRRAGGVRPARGPQRVPARTPSTSCTGCSTTPGRPPTSAACCSPATARRPGTAAGPSARAATSASAGRDGYRYADGDDRRRRSTPPAPGASTSWRCSASSGSMPKVVICLVPGWAAGGGHSLHVVCDLTLASREHARFRQTDADVASFDGGFGSAYLARQVGQKFAREIFFLGDTYTADDAHRMGMVNAVVAHDRPGAGGARVGPPDHGQEPDGAAHARSSPSTSSTTGWWASRCSPARPPGWPTGPTRPPRAATPSWSSATPTGRALPLALLTTATAPRAPFDRRKLSRRRMRIVDPLRDDRLTLVGLLFESAHRPAVPARPAARPRASSCPCSRSSCCCAWPAPPATTCG